MAQNPNPALPCDPCHEAPQIAPLHPCYCRDSCRCINLSECFSKAGSEDFLNRLDQAIHEAKGGSLLTRRLSLSTLVIDLAFAVRLSWGQGSIMDRGTARCR
ncbi:hypothetical protein FIBSPDRAFT_846348 [Athelia psychrophila]|uniref:Uncharacterized protein n=1 Tax=Athelia psychrophila TaxID=1759441 RepID=A0A166WYH8_9AGAM|nr:hypothetical protein FIBSPDRAFT_846348 [Fibularhizoctonia sp. CBS 109695]